MANLVLSIGNAASRPAVGMLVIIGIVFLVLLVAVGYLSVRLYKFLERIRSKPDNE